MVDVTVEQETKNVRWHPDKPAITMHPDVVYAVREDMVDDELMSPAPEDDEPEDEPEGEDAEGVDEDSHLKATLEAAAVDHDLDTAGKKADIAERLSDAGLTDDDVEAYAEEE